MTWRLVTLLTVAKMERYYFGFLDEAETATTRVSPISAECFDLWASELFHLTFTLPCAYFQGAELVTCFNAEDQTGFCHYKHGESCSSEVSSELWAAPLSLAVVFLSCYLWELGELLLIFLLLLLPFGNGKGSHSIYFGNILYAMEQQCKWKAVKLYNCVMDLEGSERQRFSQNRWLYIILLFFVFWDVTELHSSS